MPQDKKVEHHLLKIYNTDGVHARWFLVMASFDTYNRLGKDNLWRQFNEAQKLDIKCYLQLDIISKLMMYSEDIAIFSWAFLNGLSFYEMLDRTEKEHDLGKKIKDFYDSVDSLSDQDIYTIMNYTLEDKLDLDNTFKELTIRNMKSNATTIKRIFNEIGIFGRTNHPFYKRFKHAALPIAINTQIEFREDYMQGSETYSIAYIEKNNPFLKPRVIPFSKEVMISYFLLFKSMDELLRDMTSNRIEGLERGLHTIIPRSGFQRTIFSPSERILWDEKILGVLLQSSSYLFSRSTQRRNYSECERLRMVC